VKIAGTRDSFASFSEWIDLHHRRLIHGRASAGEYRRIDNIFHGLTSDMVMRSFDTDGLRRLNDYLHLNSGHAGVRFDAGSEWRPHLTALKIAVHNRLHGLETGAAFRNRLRHGPVDPSRMPDRALDRVIQTCGDKELVERCRVERAARLRAAA
jgi:hypothetical protein